MEEGIEWVQANCPVTSIKAQMYCQACLEKLNALFNRIANQKLIASLHMWREGVDFLRNQEKAEKYMQWKGSRRLVKMLQDWELKLIGSAWDKWHHIVVALREAEFAVAATEIERIVRGFVGRRRVAHRRRNVAAVRIQSLARGVIGRRQYRQK